MTVRMFLFQFYFFCIVFSLFFSKYTCLNTCETDKYPPKTEKPVNSVIINLDLPPQERWATLTKDKKGEIKNLIGHIRSFIGDFSKVFSTEIFSFVDSKMGYLADTLPAPFGDEIKGIANATGIPVGEVVLYNLFYEIFTVCTSIVGQNANGKLFHARNLDFGLFMGWNFTTHSWSLTDALKPVVVNIDYQKNGKTVYKSVNFAGYIGLLTAVKPGIFTYSMDERFKLDGGYIGIIEWLIGKRDIHWMGFLARNTLLHANSFSEAVQMLSDTKQMAPAYYILGGNKPGEGAVITRDRTKTVDIWRLNPANGTWYLLETNYDHWQNPPFYDDRRTQGRYCMDKLSSKEFSIAGLYNVLSTQPTLNKLTTYTALMSVEDGTLETYLRSCPQPCFPW